MVSKSKNHTNRLISHFRRCVRIPMICDPLAAYLHHTCTAISKEEHEFQILGTPPAHKSSHQNSHHILTKRCSSDPQFCTPTGQSYSPESDWGYMHDSLYILAPAQGLSGTAFLRLTPLPAYRGAAGWLAQL